MYPRFVTFPSLVVTLTSSRPQVFTTDKSITPSEMEIYCPSTNAGTVYWGNSDITSSTAIPRAAGTIWGLEALTIPGESKQFALHLMYLLGTPGDKIIIQYRGFSRAN